MARITFETSDETKRKLKAICAADGKTIKQFLTDLVARALIERAMEAEQQTEKGEKCTKSKNI